MLNNGTTNEFITHVISDDGALLHSGGDVDLRFSFFLNNTLLRIYEKQVDVLEHKRLLKTNEWMAEVIRRF